jgi:hypothetical protein
MFQCDQVFSKTDVANYTVETAEKMNVVKNQLYFWTKHQKNVIESKKGRIIFTSEFGTGKTTLLKAKAKQLAKERHLKHLKDKSKNTDSSSGKIFFVVFVGQDALLTQSLKSEMEEHKDHVEIISLTSELVFS